MADFQKQHLILWQIKQNSMNFRQTAKAFLAENDQKQADEATRLAEYFDAEFKRLTDEQGISGFVITLWKNRKNNEYTICDFAAEGDAEAKYAKVISELRFPQELTCQKAWLKESSVYGKFWIERE